MVRIPKLSSSPPSHVTFNPGWAEILYASSETVRTMRLDYRIGGAKENTPYRSWSVTSELGTNVLEEDVPMLHVSHDVVEEFIGTPEDLSRALCHFTDCCVRADKEALWVGSDPPRMPRRVTWTLTLLDKEAKTIAWRGADWKPPKGGIEEQTTSDEDQVPGVFVSRPADMNDLQQEIIRDLRVRIRELEGQHSTMLHMCIAGMSSLTQQSTTLMESHTNNALQLSTGVISTVGEHFELMKARLQLEIESYMGNDTDDFLEGPAGQMILEHLPQLLEQAPEMLSAIAAFLLSLADKKKAEAS